MFFNSGQSCIMCFIVRQVSCAAALARSYQNHGWQQPSVEIISNRLAQQTLRQHKAPWESSHSPTSWALYKILANFLYISAPSCDPLNGYSGQSIRSPLCHAATLCTFWSVLIWENIALLKRLRDRCFLGVGPPPELSGEILLQTFLNFVFIFYIFLLMRLVNKPKTEQNTGKEKLVRTILPSCFFLTAVSNTPRKKS